MFSETCAAREVEVLQVHSLPSLDSFQKGAGQGFLGMSSVLLLAAGLQQRQWSNV